MSIEYGLVKGLAPLLMSRGSTVLKLLRAVVWCCGGVSAKVGASVIGSIMDASPTSALRVGHLKGLVLMSLRMPTKYHLGRL